MYDIVTCMNILGVGELCSWFFIFDFTKGALSAFICVYFVLLADNILVKVATITETDMA